MSALPAAKPWHLQSCNKMPAFSPPPPPLPQPRHLQPQPLCTLRSLVWNRSQMFPAVHPIKSSHHLSPLDLSSTGLPSTPAQDLVGVTAPPLEAGCSRPGAPWRPMGGRSSPWGELLASRDLALWMAAAPRLAEPSAQLAGRAGMWVGGWKGGRSMLSDGGGGSAAGREPWSQGSRFRSLLSSQGRGCSGPVSPPLEPQASHRQCGRQQKPWVVVRIV